MSRESFSGGCQCGAVRFRATGFVDSTICHCRMCQKQFGAYYAPFATFQQVEWTKGRPERFRSSNIALRGFCRDCGTPLTYEPEGGQISIATGAFDDPSRFPPTIEFGIEARLPFVEGIGASRAVSTIETGVTSFQHPDHDT